MQTTPEPRKPLNERYDVLVSIQQLRKWAELLEGIYNRTRDEGALILLQDIRSTLTTQTKEFWHFEDIFRKEELEEFHNNPGSYPHSVITWMLGYRDEENA